MINVYEQIDTNKRKSLLVMGLFVALISFVVWIYAQVANYGSAGVIFALILAGFSSLGGYYWGDKLILAISGARPASRKKDFLFYTVTENLCLSARLPMPKLFVIDDSAPNAFATGRDPQHAVICVTTGLFSKLDRSELEGVIGHELAHVRNYDIRLMSIVTVLVGLVSLLADWFMRGSFGRRRNSNKNDSFPVIIFIVAIALGFLSPIIAKLIQLAISRRREFLADASSAMMTRFPEGLAKALEKISRDSEALEAANKATAHLYIVNPLKNQKNISRLAYLFNTHPPIEERIKALKEME